MQVVEMVLVGRVNKSLVTMISQLGGRAVGICGKDANLVTAKARNFEELGYVGDVTAVDCTIIKDLVSLSMTGCRGLKGVLQPLKGVLQPLKGVLQPLKGGSASTLAGEVADPRKIYPKCVPTLSRISCHSAQPF